MPSFPEYPYKELTVENRDLWLNRYPSWAQGYSEWHAQRFGVDGHISTPDFAWTPPELPHPLDLPDRLVSNQVPNPRPRVFISHRQGDAIYALRIAYLANAAGFDFWLDVLHLNPGILPSFATGQGIALMIEMALLNSSHVIVVYTTKTAGSEWVPYEYGRVKEPVLQSTSCSAWISLSKVKSPWPEYFDLNPVHQDEDAVKDWLKDEFTEWQNRYSGCPKGLGFPWQGKIPPQLP